MQPTDQNNNDNNKENITPPRKRRKLNNEPTCTEKVFRKSNGRAQRVEGTKYKHFIRCPSFTVEIGVIRDILKYTYKNAFKDNQLILLLSKLRDNTRICDIQQYISPRQTKMFNLFPNYKSPRLRYHFRVIPITTILFHQEILVK